MAYPDKLVERYRDPRYVGSLPKDDPHVGTGMAGSPERGDMTRIQIRVDPARGLVGDARFKAFGCGAAIACASLAAEWVHGRSLDEALAIRAVELGRALDLPADKRHCATLALEAVAAAVADYRRKRAGAAVRQ